MISGGQLARAWLFSCLLGSILTVMIYWFYIGDQIHIIEVGIATIIAIPMSILLSSPYYLIGVSICISEKDFITKEKYFAYSQLLVLFFILIVAWIKEGNEGLMFLSMSMLGYVVAGCITYFRILNVRLWKFI